ncbi:hypothetical protein HanIR_Chr15g0783311 [Helianthus annuus]|nr:hypothetical protein HanIR_Chr15g0783311 [Helianthus annuus]
MADMYQYDFDDGDNNRIKYELPIYIDNLKVDKRFFKFNVLFTYVRLMVETKKHLPYTLV